jgi:hypothetical protein
MIVRGTPSAQRMIDFHDEEIHAFTAERRADLTGSLLQHVQAVAVSARSR